ncbi:MAG: hypothetical protein ACRDR6_29265 [Pseudonocardiaceae bacterium]
MAFLTTAAGKVGDQRAQFAALDANDPDFLQKANQSLNSLDLGYPAQLPGATNSQELVRAFLAASECQRLQTPPTDLTPGPPSPLAH